VRPDLRPTKVGVDAAFGQMDARPRFVVVSRIGVDPVPSRLTDLERVLEGDYDRIEKTAVVDDQEFYSHSVWMRRVR
jgi:hypothetical protein